uniref:Uncharacterized protein n=1 Tax=Knipowitschia caucasica TaxID=637954 RepID=A0AAV2JIE2_KNICA
MAVRKEVFQSKVLRKLYASAPTLQKESTCSTLNTNDCTKLTTKKIPSENSSTGNASTPAKRIYTVLPPPADYKTHAEKSVTLPAPKTQVSAEDPAEKNEEDSSCEEHQAKDHEEKKRRRRRKKQKHHTPGLNQTKSVNEGEERLSKNKKRKLKKKRHKEKLLSMGLLPRAAAVEDCISEKAGLMPRTSFW